MKLVAFAIALGAAGCASGDDAGPVAGGGSNFHPGGQSGGQIVGRVCLASDLLTLGTCSGTGAGGLVVSLGNATAVTTASGTFAIARPIATDAGTPTFFTVSGPTIVTAVQPVATATTTTTANVISAVDTTFFNSLLVANSLTIAPGAGSIVGTVLRRGLPVSGVTAVLTPATTAGPFFEGVTPTALTTNATGARGIVFFPGVNLGPVSMTLSDLSSAGETTVDGIQVVNGGITFMDAVLP